MRRLVMCITSGLIAATLIIGLAPSAGATSTVVRPGKTWTLSAGPLGYCGHITFARRHKFSDDRGDAGTWAGTTNLTMDYRSGTFAGQVFEGTYSAGTRTYAGTLTFMGHSMSAGMSRGSNPCPV
jgi:hypothetical protein